MSTSSGGQPGAQCSRRASGGVEERRLSAFRDRSSLTSRLDRRSGDRRGAQERRRPALPPAASQELDTRALCHDLRQPLAAASILAQLLGREAGLSAVGQERLELLQRALGRLAGMLTSHLDRTRTELVDLAQLAEDVLCPAAAVSLGRLDLVEERAPLVLGDPVLLSRMLANLVSNARTAAGRTGRVRVTVGQCSDEACLVVEDSGGAEASEPGYGLGLLIVDTVASRHGGQVRCTQSELGGLRTTVLLPAVPGWQAGDRP